MPEWTTILSVIIGISGGAFGLYSNIKNNKKSDISEATGSAIRLANIEISLNNLTTSVSEIKLEVNNQRGTDQSVKEDLANLNTEIRLNNSSIARLQEDFKRYKETETQFKDTINELKQDLKKIDNKVDKAFNVIDNIKSKVGM